MRNPKSSRSASLSLPFIIHVMFLLYQLLLFRAWGQEQQQQDCIQVRNWIDFAYQILDAGADTDEDWETNKRIVTFCSFQITPFPPGAIRINNTYGTADRIECAPGHTCIIRGGPTHVDDEFRQASHLQIEKNDIEIQGFEFREAGASAIQTVYQSQGLIRIQNCIFEGNGHEARSFLHDGRYVVGQNVFSGAAISQSSSRVEVYNSTFANNTAGAGGAIATSQFWDWQKNDLLVVGCTFEENVARGNWRGYGGAIAFAGRRLDVIASVFVKNRAQVGAGAIASRHSPNFDPSELFLACNYFANSTVEKDESTTLGRFEYGPYGIVAEFCTQLTCNETEGTEFWLESDGDCTNRTDACISDADNETIDFASPQCEEYSSSITAAQSYFGSLPPPTPVPTVFVASEMPSSAPSNHPTSEPSISSYPTNLLTFEPTTTPSGMKTTAQTISPTAAISAASRSTMPSYEFLLVATLPFLLVKI